MTDQIAKLLTVIRAKESVIQAQAEEIKALEAAPREHLEEVARIIDPYAFEGPPPGSIKGTGWDEREEAARSKARAILSLFEKAR